MAASCIYAVLYSCFILEPDLCMLFWAEWFSGLSTASSQTDSLRGTFTTPFLVLGVRWGTGEHRALACRGLHTRCIDPTGFHPQKGFENCRAVPLCAVTSFSNFVILSVSKITTSSLEPHILTTASWLYLLECLSGSSQPGKVRYCVCIFNTMTSFQERFMAA